jgi:hypothetical protein
VTAEKPVATRKSSKRKIVTHLTGAALERWRLESGLTNVEGAQGFGLPIAKWHKLVNPTNAKSPLTDPVLALIRCLYTTYPDSAPNQGRPDIKEFFQWLGFKGEPGDRERFARLLGRHAPSAYRLLDGHGNPSRPVVRYIEALLQLGLSNTETLLIMEQMADMALVKQVGS